MSKIVKDPLYGYVEIDNEVMNDIIDTASFQRLRNIRQTSYSPLYHASIHNRFTHSIGVYFLGKKAIRSPRIEKFVSEEEWLQLTEIFLLACLLHDVGHAPFSHTGEKFFLTDYDRTTSAPRLYKMLLDSVDNQNFQRDVSDYHSKTKVAAPHEIMSVIVAINNFKSYIDTVEKRDFFARCITGYKYIQTDTVKKGLQNCLIELLNLNIIDVDKLDYIIRDSFTTGFQSVQIDYERLLGAVCFVKEQGEYKLAYHKSALSVIENVIYAHDVERKWIQNHPVVLYENFLVQHAIRKSDKYYSVSNSNKLFSYESISKDGNRFTRDERIRLLADEDIIYSIKNVCGDPLTEEYFSRKDRRHPVWKSEAEYRILFDNALRENNLNRLENAFKEVEKYLLEKLETPVINDDSLHFCDDEMRKLHDAKDKIPLSDFATLEKGINNFRKWACFLKQFADESGILFDFVIIGSNKFKSGFLKTDIENLLIYFDFLGRSEKIKDVSSILSAEKTRDNLFYIFYKREKKEINIKKFADAIHMEIIREP